jgi:hypothetical protein
MFPVHDPLSSLVTQAGISNVDTVLIGGQVVKRGGQLLFANIAEKKAALGRAVVRIAEDLMRECFTGAPYDDAFAFTGPGHIDRVR